MSTRTWMVRAAEGGRLADDFRDKGVVAIGWRDIGNLSQYPDKQAILKAVREAWPDWPAGKVQVSASQLERFRSEPQVGDRVITYDSSRRIYHVGQIQVSAECASALREPARGEATTLDQLRLSRAAPNLKGCLGAFDADILVKLPRIFCSMQAS